MRYFNSVGERPEDSRVGIGVEGSAVGEGPSVGGGPTVSATTVLMTAVISMGVASPLPGMMGAHAERKTRRITVKTIIFFIQASLSWDLHKRLNVPVCFYLRTITHVCRLI